MARKKSTANTEAAEDAAAEAAARQDEADALAAEQLEVAKGVLAETLTGDMRDFILDRIRYEQDKRPWDQRSENDQRTTVSNVESACHKFVTKAVEIIAANGHKPIKATLEQVTVKDGIVGKIVMSKHDSQRHALQDAVGSMVMIVVADPEAFTGERAPVTIKADQPDLPMSGVVHSDDAADLPFE